MRSGSIGTRVLAAVAVMLLGGSIAAAQERSADRRVDTYETAIRAFTADNQNTPLGDLTVGQIRALMARLSVLRQETAFVKKSAAASFFMPGSGHVMNRQVGKGVLFGLGELAISGGTLVGAYFVLPESVQFGQIDYFDDSFATIEAAWKQLSFTDVLPALGVMTAGGIVDMVYRGLVSRSAAKLARERIESGDKRFEPEFGMFLGAGRRPMMGMRHRF